MYFLASGEATDGSGALDGKQVEEKTWKLVFDTKAFRYDVPDELSE